MIQTRLDLRPRRVPKVRKNARAATRRMLPDGTEQLLPDDSVVVVVPGDKAELIRAIAKFEERPKAVVVRSLLLLGLRVYRKLAEDQISPYPPAHIEVTNEEVAEVATDIQDEEKKRHMWSQQRFAVAQP